MSSTRLPGKTLADICGRPLIQRVIERVIAAKKVDDVVVATTSERADDALARVIGDAGWCDVFRGPEQDVLARYVLCARTRAADVVVRITADDPLKDPEIIDQAISVLHSDDTVAYCSNTLKPTYPEGLDVEVVRATALERAHERATLASDREHVTPFIWRQPDHFELRSLIYERDLSHWRWTVDKSADLTFVRAVFSNFHDTPLVSYKEVIAWLDDHPEVVQINAGITRNEGYLRSLRSDTHD